MADYTVVAFGVMIVIALGDYLLGGRRRYKGSRLNPVVIVAEEMDSINAEDGSGGKGGGVEAC